MDMQQALLGQKELPPPVQAAPAYSAAPATQAAYNGATAVYGAPQAADGEADRVDRVPGDRVLEARHQRDEPDERADEDDSARQQQAGDRAEPGGAHRAVVPGQADECAALPRGERDRPEHRRPPRERLAQLAAEDAPPGADDVAVLVARHIHGHAGAGGQGGAGREHRQAARKGEGVDDDEVGGAGPGPVEGRVQPE